jgi:cytochrome b6-f complex iron-sulfur subunit
MMKRRRFLKVILAFIGTITSLSFVYSILEFLTAIPTRAADAKKLLVRKNDIHSGEAKNIIYQGEPAILINRPEKGFIALTRTCTHLGCLVTFNKSRQELICPCHAGTYDLEGNVISGPPPKPLTVIPLRIDGDTIIIG